MLTSPLRIFEPNRAGRDFCISDLHGALPCLVKLLDGLQFDRAKDRLFSVGDLVDRGPHSFVCLSLINEPWFHTVVANHEILMLEAFRGHPNSDVWVMNGGMWGLPFWVEAQRILAGEPPEYDYTEFYDLLAEVQQLPAWITVHMADGTRRHIVHAELPRQVQVTDQELEDPELVRQLLSMDKHPCFFGGSLLWGREIFGNFKDMNDPEKIRRTAKYHLKPSDVLTCSPIISGHTILQRPMTVLGRTAIDTAAYRACEFDAAKYAALTCVELATWKFYQATPTEFREVQPIVIGEDDLK